MRSYGVRGWEKRHSLKPFQHIHGWPRGEETRGKEGMMLEKWDPPEVHEMPLTGALFLVRQPSA